MAGIVTMKCIRPNDWWTDLIEMMNMCVDWKRRYRSSIVTNAGKRGHMHAAYPAVLVHGSCRIV